MGSNYIRTGGKDMPRYITKRGKTIGGSEFEFKLINSALNKRVREVIIGDTDLNVNLVQLVLNSLPKNLQLGINGEEISIEQDGNKIKIYPTDISKEFGLLIAENLKHIKYLSHFYSEDSTTIFYREGRNIYQLEIFNRRPHIDKLHTIRLKD